MAQDFPEHPLS